MQAVCWLSACFAAVIGQSAINLGLLIMSPILISEICPHHTRAAISQVSPMSSTLPNRHICFQFTQVVPIAFAVINVALFPSYRATFGASPFYIFSICCAVLAIALNLLVSPIHPKSILFLLRWSLKKSEIPHPLLACCIGEKVSPLRQVTAVYRHLHRRVVFYLCGASELCSRILSVHIE